MTFVSNAELIAREEMLQISPELVDKFSYLIRFLAEYPETAPALRGASAPAIGSAEYIKRQAMAFSKNRKPEAPKPPSTTPDEMVSVILNGYFDVPRGDLDRVKREHQLSMGAESFVGKLLERYLASVLENHGWIWCCGALVKAVDFVKPPRDAENKWRMLQVKNRDNSENSSSSAIRNGTTIDKWHRTFSRRQGANWGAFPDEAMRPFISEVAFEKYVRSYLKAVK